MKVLIALVALAVGFFLGRWTRAPHYQLIQEHGVILRLNSGTGQTCIAAPGDWSASDEATKLVQTLPRCE